MAWGKEGKSQLVQVIFLIVMIIAIAGLFYSTITIIRYKDILSNPLGYNLEKFGIDYCNCVKDNGDKVMITKNLRQDSQQINFTFNP